ncbi:glycoside hydrolase family 2 protein [Paenibacillus sp. P46E]|uniref:glycoside hydrolase family 2 protein n=1 Tax=Paenibacillus sp. P46E TaxID=1349436 RepID=UPI00093F94C7|nr:glycoside hydrolase family 2 TIM barrel-domain containing protein [Paenibacillus sp. P46E]OKP98798.1 beta-glucuronidase [Paenibacillus sp. P46E]
MERLFRTHHVRLGEELEGMWDFAPLDASAEDIRTAVYTHRLPVPGCWEQHPDFSSYRGKGVYRNLITVHTNGALRLIFKGVSHTARVYLNGSLLAEHYNAYTAFAVLVPDIAPGVHELAVLVDNSFSEASSLHVPNDYYTYGGLIRPVIMEQFQGAFIEQVRFRPYLVDEEWNAEITVKVCNPSSDGRKVDVDGTLDHDELFFGSVWIDPGETTSISKEYVFKNVKAWSSENPNLYPLALRLHTAGEAAADDLIERVGFRTVEAQGGAILLNGEPVILRGFNRHEDHPMAGAALPVSLMVRDLELIRDMNANAVRTSHYPNDERFLDLCDEYGLLVWEENHARGLSIEQMRNPNFIRQCEQVNREMVEQHYNHPSVIIWAILNECASDLEEGRVHYKRQLEQIRALDGSRPLTFASHQRERELCFDLADIVSFNLYPGWYTDEDPGDLCDQARSWADQNGGLGKPMIMSEFGADGYYGLRDSTANRGTEERQAMIMQQNLSAYTTKSYLSGMLIWQFSDCRVSEGTDWLITRAGTQNSKGIVDRYRRPKLAYQTVKDYYGRLRS